ncbi:hypothetical protein GLAREA_08580 [Glarea lozoyensis ATCC 20868]|uniref:Uncharacterized protein n=1 Tax=Glarea lozoyensis (strain ATCC 20868 / MF5171) TaxID=1116229 RepID=S3CDZ0_GLAL2|nr:uncharacterized protein GLAREA_08580 [Glarea lozoyensis ATCC 20868]EPE24727.1 hypothetical protein GLAREA_08580 [Glarea lozoyensis ATCC 20868]
MEPIPPTCSVPPDPDISGPGIRITVAFLPAIGVVFAILLNIYRITLRILKRQFAPPLVLVKVAEVFEEANNVQLGLAIVYCFVSLTIIHRIDAFHLRFLLDQAILSGLSKSLAKDILRTVKVEQTVSSLRANVKFWKDAILHFILSVLYLTNGVIFLLKLRNLWQSNSACFHKLFYSDTIPISILLGVIVISVQIRSMIPPRSGPESRFKKWSRLLIVSFLTPSCMILVGVFDVINYEASKMFLADTESRWGIGQVLPPLFLGVQVVGLIWRAWGVVWGEMIAGYILARQL